MEATIDVLGNRTSVVFDSKGRQEATIDLNGQRSTTVFGNRPVNPVTGSGAGVSHQRGLAVCGLGSTQEHDWDVSC